MLHVMRIPRAVAWPIERLIERRRPRWTLCDFCHSTVDSQPLLCCAHLWKGDHMWKIAFPATIRAINFVLVFLSYSYGTFSHSSRFWGVKNVLWPVGEVEECRICTHLLLTICQNKTFQTKYTPKLYVYGKPGTTVVYMRRSGNANTQCRIATLESDPQWITCLQILRLRSVMLVLYQDAASEFLSAFCPRASIGLAAFFRGGYFWLFHSVNPYLHNSIT